MTDFDRSFERATNVGLVFIIIALFALFIQVLLIINLYYKVQI